MSDHWHGLAGNGLHPFNQLNQTHTTHLRQDLAGTHLHHFHPLNQTDNPIDSKRSPEFNFWEAQPMNDNETTGELEIHTQNGYVFDAHSPPLWKASETITSEVYPPLLPYNHHYSDLSPKSRIQTILKGRKDLMEMIQHVPESSYELSLKDIVDHNILQNSGQDIRKEDLDCETEVQVHHHTKKVKKNTKTRTGQIYRSASMNNNTFLLKMFFPTSLTMKSSRTGKCEKDTSLSSSLDPESREYTEGSKKRFSITGQRSSSSSNGISISHAENSFFHCCWPSLHTKKSKTWRQRAASSE